MVDKSTIKIAKSLNKAMIERDYSPVNLAADVGVGYNTISRWRNAKCTIKRENMVKLCEVLEYKESEFIALGE